MKAIGVGCGLGALALIFVPGWGPAGALGLALLAAGLLDPTVVRRVLRPGTLLAVVLAALSVGVLAAWLSSPRSGAAVGGSTLLRLITVFLLAGLLARSVDSEALARMATRAHMARFGLALGLALNALPHVGEALRDGWVALASRRGRRRPRVRDFPRLAETMLAHTARIAEEAAAAAALRGHAALLRHGEPLAAAPVMVVVTGTPGAGKTPTMAEAAAALRARGVAVAGFVQMPVRGPKVTEGFVVRAVVSGEECRLARRVSAARGEHGTPFQFERAGFAFARRALTPVERPQVLFADEIGPVELRGAGHMPALRRALSRAQLRAAVVSVRRHLVPAFLAQLAAPAAAIVDVSESADGVAAVLAALAPVLPVSATLE
jgi:nucleoside-triphosphatase THEP1